MQAAIALGLFFFFSLVLVVLCVRMRNKPSMFASITQEKSAATQPDVAQEESEPKFPKIYIPKKRSEDDETIPQDTDYEDAMLGLGTAKVGNVFWSAHNHHHNDD